MNLYSNLCVLFRHSNYVQGETSPYAQPQNERSTRQSSPPQTSFFIFRKAAENVRLVRNGASGIASELGTSAPIHNQRRMTNTNDGACVFDHKRTLQKKEVAALRRKPRVRVP